MGPRFLYLHGFASGPRSTKGMALERHFEARGLKLERLDLRVPSLAELSFPRMLARTIEAIGTEHDRAVLLGSSLGGLTAARAAERDPRVCALVLLAPAFQLAQRWRQRLGDEWRAWEQSGWREVEDYAEQRRARVHFAFVRELLAMDRGFPDVRVPTLIVHGIHDDAVDIALSRQFSGGKRHVRLIEVDDGHELIASLPRIRDEIDRFLAPFGLQP